MTSLLTHIQMATYKELPEQWKGSIPTSVEQSGQSAHYQSSNAGAPILPLPLPVQNC